MGNIEATRQGIANEFEKFYKDLHPNKTTKQKDNQGSEARLETPCDHPNEDIANDEQDRHILEFTRKEWTVAIDSVKRGKSADSRRIKEDIKGADDKAIPFAHGK